MKNFILFLNLIFISSVFNAQDLNTHYNYLMNWYTINPAYTGSYETTKVIVDHSSQWIGMDGSPRNSMIALHGPMKNMGLGGKIIVDQRGVFNNLSANLDYSYKLNITKDQILRFGTSVGFFQTYLNNNRYINNEFTDVTDPNLASEYVNQASFLFGAGLVYKYKTLEVGLSIPHLVFSGKKVSNHISGQAKYTFNFEKSKIDFTPSIVFQHLTDSPSLIDAAVMAKWNKLLWGQFTYRNNNSMIGAIGVSFKGFDFGYAYTFNQSPNSLISNSSQEVILIFSIPKNKKVKKEKSNLSSVLTDLRSINTNSNDISTEDKQEISSIQKELSDLIKKAQSKEGLSEEEEKKMKELETRIKALKSKIEQGE